MTLWTASEVYSSVVKVCRLGVTAKGCSKHLCMLLGCTRKCLRFQRTLKGNEIGEVSGTQKPREGKGKEVTGVDETLIRKLILQMGRLRPDPKALGLAYFLLGSELPLQLR